MDPKDIIRPRVLVEYPVDADRDQRRTAYCAGYIDGISGGDVTLIMPIGRHDFSRKDGRWLAGDCLNYKDAAIMDFEKVEASIKAGYAGDVAEHEKTFPMAASS